jgi:hypothetical protein
MLTPVFFQKSGTTQAHKNDAKSIQSWATFVYKGNKYMEEAYEYFKNMGDDEEVVVFFDEKLDEPVKWQHTINPWQ